MARLLRLLPDPASPHEPGHTGPYRGGSIELSLGGRVDSGKTDRSGGSRVLVTSNDHNWRGVGEPIEIRVWPTHIGAEYLIACTGRTTERDAAEQLSEALGGLPLAHEQATAYCERLELPLSEYARRFASAPTRLLDDGRYSDRHGSTVAKTFGIAIEEATQRHPGAKLLIQHVALLAPEPIPLFLFREGRQEFKEPLASLIDGYELDEAIAALRAFALVDRQGIADERDPAVVTDTITLHRLVREVAAAQLTEAARDKVRRALIAAMAAVFPADVSENPKSWRRARFLDPLAQALIGQDRELPEGSEELACLLIDRVASYRYAALGDYAQVRRLYERALVISERILGPEHPDTVGLLNNFAALLRDQGDLTGARPILERALAIREKTLGLEHPYTAQSLNDLARLQQDQGDLAGARCLFERALAIREKTLGPEHPYTAQSLNDLARLLQDQGDLAGGRRLLERALAIHERALGSEHPYTATSFNNLAKLLQEQGDFAAARPLLERALIIYERILGPDHPNSASTLNNLGLLFQAQGDLSGARPLLERALAIREKTLGPDHPDTASSLNSLGLLLQAQNDFTGARPLVERALAIREKTLGPDHLHTAQSLNNLARLLKDQAE